MYEPLIFAGHILIFEMLMSQQTTHVVSCYLTLFAIFKSFPCFSSQVEVLTKIQSPEGNIPRGKKRKFSLSWRSRATVKEARLQLLGWPRKPWFIAYMSSFPGLRRLDYQPLFREMSPRSPPPPTPDSRGPERAAEIEPNCIGTTSIWTN